MIEFIGGMLQFLSAAAVVAAFVLFLYHLTAKKQALPALPGKDAWFSGGNARVLMWAAVAALGSRAALAALAYLALACVHAFGGPELNALITKYDADFGKPFPPLSAFFNRWDAPHYLDIARYGYTSDLNANGGEQHWFIVFYPLLPALIALLKPIFGTEFSAATVIAWGCLAGACYWIYKLALLDCDKTEAKRAVRFLLIFPAAVFLGAPYTESLFLLLTALCLYALRKGHFWAAGVAGFLAALTRNLGLLLVVPFAFELADRLGLFRDWSKLRSGRFWLDFFRHGAWVLLIPLGMGVYLLINQIAYGDPFAFLAIQSDHWGQRLQPFWKTVESNWDCLVGDRLPAEKQYLWAPQLAGIAAMLAALPFMMRKLRPSYAAYLLVYVAVALSPAWLLSFTRYMMGAVPLFLGIAALTRRRWADVALSIVFTALMLFLAAGFFMWKMVV